MCDAVDATYPLSIEVRAAGPLTQDVLLDAGGKCVRFVCAWGSSRARVGFTGPAVRGPAGAAAVGHPYLNDIIYSKKGEFECGVAEANMGRARGRAGPRGPCRIARDG